MCGPPVRSAAGSRVLLIAGMLDGMGRDEMRAADGDRQRVADALRGALDEGRLDLHEYDERLQRTYAAKTYGELDALLSDLPVVIPHQQSQVAPFVSGAPAPAADVAGAYPNATRRWLVETWDDYLGTVGITIAIWAVVCLMSEEILYFWPGWVAGPWGAFLLWETIRGLSSGEPQRWSARQVRKQAEKLAKKQAKRERQELDDGDTRSAS
jgi:hypothetical protein